LRRIYDDLRVRGFLQLGNTDKAVDDGTIRFNPDFLELRINGEWVKLGFDGDITLKTGDYTATIADGVLLVDATSGDVDITLYTAVGNGRRELTVIKVDGTSNTVNILTNGSETINDEDDAATSVQHTSLTFVSDNANWQVI